MVYWVLCVCLLVSTPQLPCEPDHDEPEPDPPAWYPESDILNPDWVYVPEWEEWDDYLFEIAQMK